MVAVRADEVAGGFRCFGAVVFKGKGGGGVDFASGNDIPVADVVRGAEVAGENVESAANGDTSGDSGAGEASKVRGGDGGHVEVFRVRVVGV